MNTFSLTAGALAALLAGGIAASAANMPSTTSTTPAYAAPVIADADAMKAADQLHHTNIRQQLQDQLSKAGYTAVKIMPSSFFVEAKDNKGNPVAMVIGPDSFTEVTELAPKTMATTAQQAPNTTSTQK